jgi:hypothetical protein
MSKEEKTRMFETELLALPPLKMVLVNSEKDQSDQTTKKAKKKAEEELNEETVIRIIGKLSMKE